jgi:hypothetical protein
MTEPRARVLADSVSPAGRRLTTLEVVMHRYVLAEFNTHRVFSRNSASSRAIPVRKMLDRVAHETAFPGVWSAKQRGMQGGEPLSEYDVERAEAIWRDAADDAIGWATKLDDLGVHKSIVNRLLEPFLWHTVIVSATDWDGFWKQRCSPLAQPEIRVPAEAMRAAYNASEPNELNWSDWHLPLIHLEDWPAIEEFVSEWSGEHGTLTPTDVAKDISAARCARVSYLTHDGKRDIREDIQLAGRLKSASPPHASPFEHVATPDWPAYVVGNFTEWSQYRHELWPDF